MVPLLIAAVVLQHYPAALVTIDVQADRGHRAHTITISPPSGRRPRSAEALDALVWVATRTWDGGQQTVTSEECPAVGRIASSFGELPPLQVNPPALSVTGGEPIPIPPTIKDGFVTTLSFRTLTDDGSFADVQIAHGNVYRHWGHDAVGELISCWGPL